ncbi:MAG: cyclase family protein [Rhodospirillales bacterium]|nr:cyclase family protein [Rhodospirillales bacterium]
MGHKLPGRIIDVTIPLSPTLPVWPGDPRLQLESRSRIADGGQCNVTSLTCSVHTGTHVDAPVHFFDGADGVEILPLEILIGPVSVVDVGDASEITPEAVDAVHFKDPTRRVFFKSTNSQLWNDLKHPFYENFVALSPEAAQRAVERDIKLIGVDYLSVQRFHDAEPWTHHTLLDANVIIVEGLDLREVEPGHYDLICLPLKIQGCDGSPARVVLKELSE